MVVLSVFFVLYFVLMILLLAGWKRNLRADPAAASGREQLISVVVPVRNEERRIGALLASLSRQTFAKFEVIVVNDHSEDETLWVLSRHGLKNMRVLNSKGTGKKAALATGINAAKGAVIVTTDGDCEAGDQWLSLIHRKFLNRDVMMAFGGVRMTGDGSFLSDMQEMEFSSLVGSGAATAAWGAPVMCSGANLSFRKSVFREVKGYQGNLHIPSGDDEFLMRKVQARYPKGISFLADPDAVVVTPAASSPEAFFHQRVRWASKWKHNDAVLPKLLAVVIVVIQAAMLVNWIVIFASFNLLAIFLWIIKMILEASFLLQVCRFVRVRWNWLAFFAWQLLYPVYVLITAVSAFFVPFQWKNRIFKAS